MIKQIPHQSTFCIGILFTLIFSSCSTANKTAYFRDVSRTDVSRKALSEYFDPVVQTDDILTINIQTIDPRVMAPVNQSGAGVPSGASVLPAESGTTGFLVDKEGNIEMPMLGVVKVVGLTTSQIKELVRQKAATFYKSPTIQVRFSNFKITVLGEVAKPATYTIPNERISVLEAISLAGDLTIYGKRDDVMLIRHAGDYKEITHLDLNSSALISSPYFYLRQNDVLYVEPTKARASVNNAPKMQFITIAIAVATLIVTAVRF